MKWEFSVGGRQHQASYEEGLFQTNSSLVGMIVENMITNKRQVKVGYFGQSKAASLSTDELAWATISEAVRIASSDSTNTFPVMATGIENDIVSSID